MATHDDWPVPPRGVDGVIPSPELLQEMFDKLSTHSRIRRGYGIRVSTDVTGTTISALPQSSSKLTPLRITAIAAAGKYTGVTIGGTANNNSTGGLKQSDVGTVTTTNVMIWNLKEIGSTGNSIDITDQKQTTVLGSSTGVTDKGTGYPIYEIEVLGMELCS